MATSRGKGRREHASAGGASVPRYQDLAAELIAAIRDGTFPVGSQFPSEHQLCEDHAVSRFTVRAALDTLERQGYVSRRPKIGTLVIADRPQPRYRVFGDGSVALSAPVRDSRLQVLAITDIEADPGLAEWLGCEVADPWIHLEAVHRTTPSGQPLCVASYYLQPAHRRLLRGLDRAVDQASPLPARLERLAPEGIAAIEQDLQAQRLGRRHARALSVAEGTPALRLSRRMSEGPGARALFAVVSLHPADTFRFSQRLAREP